MTQYELEQRRKRLETRISIAINYNLYDEADQLNDELYAVDRALDSANRNEAGVQ